jgi:hypothetical protein
MLQHRRLEIWEKKLKDVFDRIDDHLEEKYGKIYPLHPHRAKRGATSNKEQDGLFNVGASYSLGIGSKHGAGYVVEVRFVTLKHVNEGLRHQIEEEVAEILKREIPRSFPDRPLRVDRDGNVYKIYGDLSLGVL